MTSFSEDMRRRGMVPASRTLGLEVVPAGARLGRLLHVSPSEPVVVVKRLRLADGETMAIETLHVRDVARPRPDAPPTSRAHPSTTCSRTRYGIVIVGRHADDRADGDERGGVGRARRAAPLAGVPVRARPRAREQGEIVEYVRSIYRGDRYRLVTELAGRSRSPHRPALAVGSLVSTASHGRGGPARADLVQLVLTSVAILCNCPRRGQSGLNQLAAPVAALLGHRGSAGHRPSVYGLGDSSMKSTHHRRGRRRRGARGRGLVRVRRARPAGSARRAASRSGCRSTRSRGWPDARGRGQRSSSRRTTPA